MALEDYLDHQPIGLLSHHYPADHNRDSFVHTNTLLKRPVALPPVFVHFWTTSQTVILGMQDLRLPQLPQALDTLRNWHPFVRNSGGLGVVSDDLVLNCSLFLPAEASLSIQAAYQLMADLIGQALPEADLTIGEVAHSYCPGSYDLSINGQKFAGLAQRRTSQGIAVMAYLSVAGDQFKRGELMRRFYQAGGAIQAAKFHYPAIDPTCMNSLDQLLNQPLTVGLMQARLVRVLAQHAAIDPLLLPTAIQQPAYQAVLAEAAEDMTQRQEALHAR